MNWYSDSYENSTHKNKSGLTISHVLGSTFTTLTLTFLCKQCGASDRRTSPRMPHSGPGHPCFFLVSDAALRATHRQNPMTL